MPIDEHILQRIKSVVGILEEESQRGLAIVLHTWIDEELKPILSNALSLDRKHLPPSFTRKLHLAKQLNIIDSQIQKDLESINWIRNRFAHELEALIEPSAQAPLSFTNEPISSRCRQLHYWTQSTDEAPTDAAILYRDAAVHYAVQLAAKRNQIPCLKLAEPAVRFSPYQWIPPVPQFPAHARSESPAGEHVDESGRYKDHTR